MTRDLVIVAVTTLVFYTVLYQICRHLWFKFNATFAKVADPAKQHEWTATTVSFVNSTLQAVFTCYLYYASFLDVENYEILIRPWIVFFAFYTIYDFFSSLACGAYVFRKEPGLVPHHVIVSTSLIVSLYVDPFFLWFQIIASLCEVNSVFLHFRALLKFSSPSLAWLRWPNEYAMIFTYITFRYMTSSWLVWRAWQLEACAANWAWFVAGLGYWTINTIYAKILAAGYVREYRKRTLKKQ
eukprot:TRINITY_DN723_c0_g1_i1.p1 TRINITY_DN723_c0_g1~~TRINITY_DN723_c0_g1_i1.p1  ORF type:complete len:241 (-),score=16.91 TRINITY_DN723_c0_g1_i1:57-779(-)